MQAVTPESPSSVHDVKVSASNEPAIKDRRSSPELHPRDGLSADVRSPKDVTSASDSLGISRMEAREGLALLAGGDETRTTALELDDSHAGQGLLQRTQAAHSQALVPQAQVHAQVAQRLQAFLEDCLPAGERYGDDAVARMGEVAPILAKHGITTSAQLEAEWQKGLIHDFFAALGKAPIQSAGYSIGLPIHALVGTQAMTAADPSARFMFVGATTVAATTFSYTVAESATEHWFAAGPEAELPMSVVNRKSPEQKAVDRAVRTFLLDALRQFIPAGVVGHDWFSGKEVVVSAEANFKSVVSDALSRNLIPLVNTPIETITDVTGTSHPERFFLRHPDRLDAWLTFSRGKSVPQTLKPTLAGTGRTVAGAGMGALNWAKALPMNVALFVAGLAFISIGLLAMEGRASELASHRPPLPAGMETARSAFERRAIFSWGIESPLEATLVIAAMLMEKSGLDLKGAATLLVRTLADGCDLRAMARPRQNAAARAAA